MVAIGKNSNVYICYSKQLAQCGRAVLRPLPPESKVSCASLLAHAILFRDLRERISRTIVLRDKTENISARRLPPVIEIGNLKHWTTFIGCRGEYRRGAALVLTNLIGSRELARG